MNKLVGKFDWSEKLKEMESNKNNTKSSADERFWKLNRDPKSGSGAAKIRFIPDKNGVPYVDFFQHFVKYTDEEGNDKLYVGNCATTVNKECPICSLNKKYFKSIHEADHDVARARKRKHNYISNVLILKDPTNPENEGKVFLFSYGVKIFGKIQDALFPSAELGEEQIIPWDLYEGADFALQAKKVDGQINYDSSKFTSVNSLFNGDQDKIQEILEKTHSLQDFMNDLVFESPEEIKVKLSSIFSNNINTNKDNFTDKGKTISKDDLSNLEDTSLEASEDIPF